MKIDNFQIYLMDLKANTCIGKAFSASLCLLHSITTGVVLLFAFPRG